jgi:SAM-dependent methyltransferase
VIAEQETKHTDQSLRHGINALADIRQEELVRAVRWFPPEASVLELGGGSGYQAGLLARWGWSVTSLDIPQRPKPERVHFPVYDYDGSHIPFPNDAFEVVYSSCVLEHVHDLRSLLNEAERVVKPDGLLVHVVPSASWRLWTSVALYGLWMPLRATQRLRRRWLRFSKNCDGRLAASTELPEATSQPSERQAFLPGPEGSVYSNVLQEFSRSRRASWRAALESDSFEVVHASGQGLFYTGFLLAPALMRKHRPLLSRLLGSSTHLFVLRAREGSH